MSRDDKYTSEQVQRVLRVMLALAGNEFRGMTLKEVATAADCTNDNALRALENLRTAGLAESQPPRPSPLAARASSRPGVLCIR